MHRNSLDWGICIKPLFGSCGGVVGAHKTAGQCWPTNAFDRFEKQQIEQSIPDRFESQVDQFPKRIAVKYRETIWAYEELNHRANRLAQAILQRQDEGPMPVALLVEQGAHLVAAILGVLKAGKFYVPLDASHPKERIVRLLIDSQSTLIIADRSHLRLAQELAQSNADVLGMEEGATSGAADNLGLQIGPDAPAYIYYTSGSTGQPKGSLIPIGTCSTMLCGIPTAFISAQQIV